MSIISFTVVYHCAREGGLVCFQLLGMHTLRRLVNVSIMSFHSSLRTWTLHEVYMPSLDH